MVSSLSFTMLDGVSSRSHRLLHVLIHIPFLHGMSCLYLCQFSFRIKTRCDTLSSYNSFRICISFSTLVEACLENKAFQLTSVTVTLYFIVTYYSLLQSVRKQEKRQKLFNSISRTFPGKRGVNSEFTQRRNQLKNIHVSRVNNGKT